MEEQIEQTAEQAAEQPQTTPPVQTPGSFFADESEAKAAWEALAVQKRLDQISASQPKAPVAEPEFKKPDDWEDLHPDEKVDWLERKQAHDAQVWQRKLEQGVQQVTQSFGQQMAPVMNRTLENEVGAALPADAKPFLKGIIEEQSRQFGVIQPTAENIRVLTGLALEKANSARLAQQRQVGEPAESFAGVPEIYHRDLAKLEAELKEQGIKWTQAEKIDFLKNGA